jgi:hypothetical protein
LHADRQRTLVQARLQRKRRRVTFPQLPLTAHAQPLRVGVVLRHAVKHVKVLRAERDLGVPGGGRVQRQAQRQGLRNLAGGAEIHAAKVLHHQPQPRPPRAVTGQRVLLQPQVQPQIGAGLAVVADAASRLGEFNQFAHRVAAADTVAAQVLDGCAKAQGSERSGQTRQRAGERAAVDLKQAVAAEPLVAAPSKAGRRRNHGVVPPNRCKSRLH